MIDYEFKEFIGIFKGVYPPGYCEHFISEFERLKDEGCGSFRDSHPTLKDDYAIAILPGIHALVPFDNQNICEGFFVELQECFNIYTEKFPSLKNSSLRTTSIKIQKTYPGGGYHTWHHEQESDYRGELTSRRALVFMLFLNDLYEDEGGETEFLYQKLRIKPTANTMIIWPAAYTHTHRGNTVLGKNSKYVITGWFFYD